MHMSELRLTKRYHKIGKAVIQPSSDKKLLWKEFDDFQRSNYRSEPIKCLCGRANAYAISNVDREGWQYELELCRNCGLIKAARHWDEESLNDYYSNWYRKLYGWEEDPDKFYKAQQEHSLRVYDFLSEFTRKIDRPYVVFDVGGAVGGVMDEFRKEADCYLFDYNELFLAKAQKKGLNAVKGGVEQFYQVETKPNLVILSHVIEHIPYLDRTLNFLRSNINVGTLVYVELPGIDSLKYGRRDCDFLKDIHRAHVYYFCKEVLNNLMSRYGFSHKKSNSEISALYNYTAHRGQLENYHAKVVSHLKSAEIRRKFRIQKIKNKIGKLIPNPIRNFVVRNRS